MKKTLLLIALSLIVIMAGAASKSIKGNIKGTVLDKTSGEAMEFVTISVLDTKKKVVTGTTTNQQGMFSVENIQAGEYILKVSYIGYADVERNIKLSVEANAVQLGTIELAPDGEQLDEVVVSARRPTVVRQMDKLVITVANTIMADNSTAVEVLRKSPGVAIDKDGNVTLNGQAVEVWVDNRPTQLSGQELVALLSATEGSTIDKIEIIDQPSSKYDAAGSGGIINIKTKKNFLKGFNGSVRAGYTQYLEDEFYYRANGSLNLNYRNDLINTYLNVSSRAAKGYVTSTENIIDTSGYRRYSETKRVDKGANGNVKAGIDFFIDKKNIIGVIGNVALRNRNDDGNGYTTESGILNPLSSLFTNTGSNNFLSGTANLNYSHYFDEGDHELTLNADFMRYSSKPEQTVRSHFRNQFIPDSTTAYTNSSEQLTNIYSVKADYIKPFGKKMKLEAGGKMSWSGTDNTIARNDSLDTRGWHLNTNLSDDFTYNENVNALYANYAWQITDKWNIKGGVRWENTATEGIWRSADSTTSKNYNDFFPTFYIGFKPAEKHNISFSYTNRIRRPNYWQLNPFKRYSSDYSYTQGNPDLKPTYSHRFNISYTGFHVLNSGIMYNYSYDDIVQIPIYDENTRQTGYVQGNFGKTTYFGIWVGVSELPITKWWTLTANFWGAYNYSENNNYSQGSFLCNVYGTNTFLLGKTWKAELEFWVSSPSKWSYFNTEPQGELNIGVQKTIWDGKGTVSLYFDDILATNRNENWTDVDGVYRENKTRWDSRSVRASFSYRFGNAGNGVKHRKVGNQEEAERVNGD